MFPVPLSTLVTLQDVNSINGATEPLPPFTGSIISAHSLSATATDPTTATDPASVPLATTTFSASAVTPIPTALQVGSSTAGTSHKGIIVGSIVGIFVIVSCLCMYRFYVYRKLKNSRIFIDVAENDTKDHLGSPVAPTSVLHPAQPNGLELHPLPSPEAILRPLRVVHSHNPQSDMSSIRKSINSHSDPFSDSHFASEYAERGTSNSEGDLSPRSSFESRMSEPSATVSITDPQTLRQSGASSLSGASTALPLYESPSLSPMPPSFHTVDPLSRHSDQTMSTLTLG